jgi:hypothetical protein
MPLNPNSVKRRLQEAAKKWRLSRASRLVLLGCILASALLAVFLALDQWLHLGTPGRWSAFALLLGSFAAASWGAWRAWRPVITLASVARRIEETSGGCGNVLISAVQFEESLPQDSPLRAAMYEEMHDPFPSIRWERVFDWDRLRKLGIGFGGVLGVLFIWAILAPALFVNSASRILMPGRPIRPITRTVVETVVPGNQVIAHGTAVQLRVILARSIPASAWVRYRDVGGAWERALMEHEAGQPVFTFDWSDVKQPLEYQIQAGDAVSEIYKITVRPRTVIRERTAEITPPEYLGARVETIQNASILQDVLLGSKVRLALGFNNAVTELKAVTEANEDVPVEAKKAAVNSKSGDAKEAAEGSMEWVVQVPTDAPHTIRVSFRDEIDTQGFASIPLTVVADEPPLVAVSEPADGHELVGDVGEQLRISFSAEDVLGLAHVGVYQSSDEKPDAVLVAEWKDLQGGKKFSESTVVTIKPLEGQPKAVYRVIAKDQNTSTGPGIGMSEPIVVKIAGAGDAANSKKLAEEKVGSGLRALIELQMRNLTATKEAFSAGDQGVVEPLLERQLKIEEAAVELSQFAGEAGLLVAEAMATFLHREIKDGIVLLRDAASVFGDVRSGVLVKAAVVQRSIMAQAEGLSALAARESKHFAVVKLVSDVQELVRNQRDWCQDLKSKGEGASAGVAAKLKTLGDRVEVLLPRLEAAAANVGFGDESLRAVVGQVSGSLKQLNLVDRMHTCAQGLQKSEVDAGLKELDALASECAKAASAIADWQLKSAKAQLGQIKTPLIETVEKFRLLEKVEADAAVKIGPLVQKESLGADQLSLISEVGRTSSLVSEAVARTVADSLSYPEHVEAERISEAATQILGEFESDAFTQAASLAMNPPRVSQASVDRMKIILEGMKKVGGVSSELMKWVDAASEDALRFLEFADAAPGEGSLRAKISEQHRLKVSDAFAEQVEGLEVELQAIGEAIPKPQAPVEQPKEKTGEAPTAPPADGAANAPADAPADAPAEQKIVADPAAHVDEKAAAASGAVVEKMSRLVLLARALRLDGDGLRIARGAMEEVSQAFREGRMSDAATGYERAMRELRGMIAGGGRSGISQSALSGALRPDQRRTMGGVEGEAPSAYKSMVVEYFRSLSEGK